MKSFLRRRKKQDKRNVYSARRKRYELEMYELHKEFDTYINALFLKSDSDESMPEKMENTG